MSFSYLPIFRLLLLVLLGWGGRVESFFFSPLRMSEVSLCRLRPHRSFSFRGLLKGQGVGLANFFSQNTTPERAWRFFDKKFVFLIPSLPLPQQRKWHADTVLKAAWKRRHTWRGEKEKGADVMAQRATGRDKGRRNNKGGKLCFPVAVTEVL